MQPTSESTWSRLRCSSRQASQTALLALLKSVQPQRALLRLSSSEFVKARHFWAALRSTSVLVEVTWFSLDRRWFGGQRSHPLCSFSVNKLCPLDLAQLGDYLSRFVRFIPQVVLLAKMARTSCQHALHRSCLCSTQPTVGSDSDVDTRFLTYPRSSGGTRCNQGSNAAGSNWKLRQLVSASITKEHPSRKSQPSRRDSADLGGRDVAASV